jgi:hypothetical protein
VTVFSFFKATRTQRDVLKKLSKMAPFMTDGLRTQLNLTLKGYLILAEARNELLHNPIARSVENQVYIMLRSPLPEVGKVPYHTKPITSAEIDDLSERIKNLNTQFREVERAIQAAKYGPPLSGLE